MNTAVIFGLLVCASNVPNANKCYIFGQYQTVEACQDIEGRLTRNFEYGVRVDGNKQGWSARCVSKEVPAWQPID